MAAHEEFLRLCAAATASELSASERATLDAHLAVCGDCRQAMKEYEVAAESGAAALAAALAPEEAETDASWSVEDAESKLFKRLEAGKGSAEPGHEGSKQGRRYSYQPSQIRWSEVWMPFAASVLLALALGIAFYRSGVERRQDIAQRGPQAGMVSAASLEEQLSDAGHERRQLLSRLAERDRTIAELRRKLEEQQKTVRAWMSANGGAPRAAGNSHESAARERQELAIAQVELTRLQKTIDSLTTERDDAASRAGTLDAKVGELTQLVRDRERELDRKQAEVAKQQELLDRDRDIRELMGARDLYIAEVHDVDGKGETSKTYSRIFYTRGKKLIFYAYDLDGQPGLQGAGTFQVWGRRGPDKLKARSLGLLYEDNVDKKRWVLKANDPKTLEDIDAVFVTAEPNGGSQHPSGKQLLFASLRLSPNHP
jgi:signal transduction histidine kinase